MNKAHHWNFFFLLDSSFNNVCRNRMIFPNTKNEKNRYVAIVWRGYLPVFLHGVLIYISLSGLLHFSFRRGKNPYGSGYRICSTPPAFPPNKSVEHTPHASCVEPQEAQGNSSAKKIVIRYID